jgi:phosphodiesterase/alkaline phosphatase D-like protein
MGNKRIGFLLVLALAFALPLAAQKPAAEKIIGEPKVEGVGDTWAVIAWTTNTGGSTVVHYGTDKNGLSETAQAPYADNEKSQAQNHRVHLKNLKPGTNYFFVVDSGHGEGTGTEAKSSVGQFTTKPAGSAGAGSAGAKGEAGEGKQAAVKITDGPRVEATGADFAQIAWTTNSASGSVVHYGTDANNLGQTAQSPYADKEGASSQTHRVKIAKLKPKTTYYYVVDSGHGEGTGTEAKSQVSQFQTK